MIHSFPIISISKGPSELSYTIYNTKDELPIDLNFMVSDVSDWIKISDSKIKNIICINDIFTEPSERNKGHASTLLRVFLEGISEDTIVITRAEVLHKYYPERPTVDEFKNTLVNLSLFFEMNGFRNMNALCNFEHSVPFVYINNISKSYIKYLLNLEIDIEDNY